MSKKRMNSSLLAPQSTGGDTAEGGFRYQANLITAKVPYWLSRDGFTEMIRESLGDAEAKFFLPGIGISREFIEYKNHQMTPSEFWAEIKHFHDMDQEAPGAYHQFVLACTGVSTSLSPVINGLNRVRNAYPFYNGAREIQEESYRDFVEVVRGQGQTERMAQFIFSKVQFEIDLTDAENRPRELFREALFKNFEIFHDLPGKVVNDAYSCLTELITSRKNQPINRQELANAIWDRVDHQYRPASEIRIHTIHSEACEKGTGPSLQFDWIRFFGGADRDYPPPEEWNEKVVGQLRDTRDWIISTKRSRKIHLSGSRRLSASVAIGSVFSSVAGFTISMETKDGIWSTDQHPTSVTEEYSWSADFRHGKPTNEMAIAIGVMKNISIEVESFLETLCFHGPVVHLFGKSPILSAEHANQAVNGAKSIILDSIAKSDAKKIHLFLAIPSQLALFLGHRLNATTPIRCYERKETNLYVPACIILT